MLWFSGQWQLQWCWAACLRGMIISPSTKDLACWHLSLPCLLALCRLDFHWTFFLSAFNTDLREKRADKWIYHPCQLSGCGSPFTVWWECYMAVSEVGGPERVLLFKRPEDSRETIIWSFTVRTNLVNNTAEWFAGRRGVLEDLVYTGDGTALCLWVCSAVWWYGGAGHLGPCRGTGWHC